ncbi:Alpha-ketoglutarate-dependent dioxygenase alkB [Hypsizygus marmoreus]|uniref:Alpha-ketoglutarate-dependent dioxygenase alkB n=1 Tax=Hypsizygus marmoreus TaxID=39966 RepID=A0A369JGJ6_HYPMA|nr:Alpha-ketoglutarate-dependent dioxygenase alkB [Hypsizygus marmoreus]
MPSLSQLHDPTSNEYKKARRLYLKATKNRDPNTDIDWTPFRAAEKKYKARFPPPDLGNVLDLATLDSTREQEINEGVWRGCSDAIEYRQLAGMAHVKAYVVPRIPGLVLLPSFVSSEKQKNLVRWSLSDQARFPNETNLDVHYVLPEQGVWNTWLNSRDDPAKDVLVIPKATADTLGAQEPPGPRQLINNTPANAANFSSISSTPKPPQAPSATIKPTLSSALVPKLRWANIGWYYHWGTKQYDFAKGKGAIHPCIRDICRDAVAAVDWRQVYGDTKADLGDTEPDWTTWNETYEPDAGIVNFYQTKDTLMAHVDRSEICATSPLVSISLGNAAVFLIGGLTRDTEPVPILLRSGDVVIMSGPECRRAYHGVPRILEGTLPSHLKSMDDDWRPYEEYLRTTRINVNVRQVFPRGFKPDLEPGNG